MTSHNVATDNYWIYLLTGGLNHQIEHHLFPSVNHCHLKELSAVTKELCKKYNVQYNESMSLWEGLCKHVKHLYELSLKDTKAE
jgi:fatty acid desaturase